MMHASCEVPEAFINRNPHHILQHRCPFNDNKASYPGASLISGVIWFYRGWGDERQAEWYI